MANSISLDRRSLVKTWPGAIIVGSSSVCFTVLVFFRLKMLIQTGYHQWKLPAVAIALSYQDFITLATLSFASLLLSLLSFRLRRCVAFTHCVLIVFVTGIGFINAIVQPLYTAPISMSLLQYSDARDFGSVHTLVGYVSVDELAMILAIFGLGPLAVYFCALMIRNVNWYPMRVKILFLVVATLYVSFCTVVVPPWTAKARLQMDTRVQTHTENPAVYFVRSIFNSSPQLKSNRDKRIFDPYESELNTDQVHRDGVLPVGYSAGETKGNSIRNVAIFVLESVGAQYLGIYGGPRDTTPRLESLLKQSLLFDSGYAPVPSTEVSMFSILTSVYPGVTPKPLPTRDPQIGLPTLTMGLKQKGYRTGVFLSADARYGRQDEFLRDRGIDRVEDHRSRHCAGALQYNIASPDRCTAASMEKWIEQSPEQPFFALMWTDQTHFPYNTSVGRDWTDPEPAQRLKRAYLLGIREADAIIQDFVDFLGRQNLLRSTLIVVVGDHGEGFGQHGVYAHGTEIYDEFVRIPFLLINPVLFDGKISHKNAGLIDLAPTIYGVLGERPPSSWQGLDLLGSYSRKYNYSFVPWSNFKISLRTHDRRYIYDVIDNRVQVFDMKLDPLETQDIGGTIAPAEIEKIKLEISDWKQAQDQYLEEHRFDLSMSDSTNDAAANNSEESHVHPRITPSSGLSVPTVEHFVK